MGNFRSKLGEGVNKIKENSKEATDIGSEMTEQADQINAILESIELQDSEDIQAMSDTGSAYQSSFDSAFSEQVETKGAEVAEQSEQVSGEAGDDRYNKRNHRRRQVYEQGARNGRDTERHYITSYRHGGTQ